MRWVAALAVAWAADPWAVLEGLPTLRHVEDEKSWLPRVSSAVLRRAYSAGDASRLKAFMSRVDAGAGVTVVAVGGSVTAGVMCVEKKVALQACSWSRRVFDWLRAANGGNATYRNVARATTTRTRHGFSPRISSNHPTKRRAHMTG